MSRSKTLLVECERCGHQHTVERAGRFRDEDFYELFHDYSDLEAESKRVIARLELELAKALRDAQEWRWLADNWQFLADLHGDQTEARQAEESECPF